MIFVQRVTLASAYHVIKASILTRTLTNAYKGQAFYVNNPLALFTQIAI